jgi:hypothetical protein
MACDTVHPFILLAQGLAKVEKFCCGHSLCASEPSTSRGRRRHYPGVVTHWTSQPRVRVPRTNVLSLVCDLAILRSALVSFLGIAMPASTAVRSSKLHSSPRTAGVLVSLRRKLPRCLLLLPRLAGFSMSTALHRRPSTWSRPRRGCASCLWTSSGRPVSYTTAILLAHAWIAKD